MPKVKIRVPASTANLGPAFDCLGLALDLWNETSFEPNGDELVVEIGGEGENEIPRDKSNLIVEAFKRVYAEARQEAPAGLQIKCEQKIPLGSGLGSSAAAILAGMLGANALLGEHFKTQDLLQFGAEMEGHADNLAAALFGGLVLVTQEGGRQAAQRLDCVPLYAVVVLPEVRLTTKEARIALPKQVPLADVVFNIGRSLQVAEALRQGDIPALATAMQDKLHQPHRLPLIPGAAEALEAARQAGAAAALSGAGPGLIAFVEEGREKAITEALRAPLAQRGIKTSQYLLRSSDQGAQVELNS